MLELETKTSVRQFAVGMVEVLVNGSGIDQVVERDGGLGVKEAHVCFKVNVAVVQQRPNHRGVPLLWEGLVGVLEVAVVPRNMHRDTPRDGRSKFFGREAPLLGRIAIEKVFIDEIREPAKIFRILFG